MSKGATHKELAALLGLSETTIKSYRRKFPDCIPVASYGKPIRFTDDAVRVVTRIRDLFETGMGVPDVRARLAGEFAWITAEAPGKAAAPEKGGKGLTPELSQGVSNMARSLVDMSQKQKAILKRLEGLESLFEDMGLNMATGEAAQAARERRQAENREREEKLEARLDHLDENSRTLAATVNELAGQLSRFLGDRDKAAHEWRGRAADTMAEAAGLAEEARNNRKGATVIAIRPEKPPTPVTDAGPAEPARAFFSLPLVVRTEQGHYISAGGRNRGRFSLNDLKAMLIYGFMPPNHFSLRWEAHGQGWWLYLEQEQGERAVHLLLMELPTGKGGNVAEILKLRYNNETRHPAEICGIIDSFGS
ncbi:helix-turn-helix domain-containing protein [Desulfovibrio sp. OttesenSCG-928-F20]|nr:helix-turn-helix domain-containing protein [Desulfovibrio sp. OttesenSCG-928-F20]